jgi:hypothetical protein
MSSPLSPAGELKTATEAAQNLIAMMKEMKGLFAFFKSMPRVALVKIDKVLNEVEKTVDATRTASNSFLEIALDADKIRNPDALIDLASTKLQTMIGDQRGHSSTIRAIREQYLDGVLNYYFKKEQKYYEEASKLNKIFFDLTDADKKIFSELATTATYMQARGQQALMHALGGRHHEAKKVVSEAAMELLELQSSLRDVKLELSSIRAEFIELMKISEVGGP